MFRLSKHHATALNFNKKPQEIIDWTNAVAGSTISGFDDDQLKSGHVLLTLLENLGEDLVSWDDVSEGNTDAEIESNAKYVISVAQKVHGLYIFLVWEDIV